MDHLYSNCLLRIVFSLDSDEIIQLREVKEVAHSLLVAEGRRAVGFEELDLDLLVRLLLIVDVLLYLIMEPSVDFASAFLDFFKPTHDCSTSRLVHIAAVFGTLLVMQQLLECVDGCNRLLAGQ